MRFIATQRAAAGLEKPPAYETERRGLTPRKFADGLGVVTREEVSPE